LANIEAIDIALKHLKKCILYCNIWHNNVKLFIVRWDELRRHFRINNTDIGGFITVQWYVVIKQIVNALSAVVFKN